MKNPVALVRAVSIVRERITKEFSVDWVGRLGYSGDQEPSDEYKEAARLVRELGLERHIRFLGERSGIESHYQEWDALVHPSIQEGFPNAVAEGMASGLPILVGEVSDLPLVVASAKNGIVFDQNSPESIASAMQKLIDTPKAERQDMGRRSMQISREWFRDGAVC